MPRSRIVSLKATLGWQVLKNKLRVLKRRREAKRRALKHEMEMLARGKKAKPA